MDLNDEGTARLAAVTGGLLPTAARARVGGLELHYLRWGRPGDPLALLIHGNGGHAHWWDPLVPSLVPGWQLLAPDLRGHGESAWAEPPQYGLDDFGRDLLGLLDAVAPNQPVVLAGHSMGGRVAVWCAATRHERTRGLALLDTRLGGVDPEIARQWRGRIAGMRSGRSYATREEALAAFRCVPPERNVPAPVIADLAHHAVVQRRDGTWTFRFDRAVLSLDGDGAGDLQPLLRRIRCPTVAMYGERSWVMDERECNQLTAAVPHCAVRTFPGGHHFLLAHPAPVGAALRSFMDHSVGV